MRGPRYEIIEVIFGENSSDGKIHELPTKFVAEGPLALARLFFCVIVSVSRIGSVDRQPL